MLSTFRAIAKSKITLVILFIPLMLGLLMFGNVRDAFGTMAGKDAVVAAGSRVVTSPDFKRAFDNARKEFEQRAGRPVSLEEAAGQGGLEDILQSLAQREGFLAQLGKDGVRPSDKLLVAELRKIPAFFNPVTGQFDPKLYQQRLTQNGLTEAVFEGGERDDIAQNHFSSAVAAALRGPTVYAALTAPLLLEKRSFSAFAINPASLPAPAKPTDAQLAAFIKSHSAQMMEPEMRNLTVVRFSAKAIAPSLTVDPAEVQKRYDFRKDTLSTPEKRTVVQVPAKDAASAAAAAARLAKGEAPAAVAKSLGVEVVNYPDLPKSAISDPKIAQPAFSLPAGQVSQPIQGGLGWAVIKVLSITPGKVVTLAEARPALEAEVRADAAQDKIYAVVEKYQQAHEGGAGLADAAKAAGATALQLGSVTAQGTDRDGRPLPLLTPKLLKEAFSQPQGGESDVIDDGKGEYFAVRVDKVIPSAVADLTTQRDKITAFYMRTEQIRMLEERLASISDRIRKGESMDALAAASGSKVTRMTLDRRSADQAPQQQRPLFTQVFSAKAGEVFTIGAGVVKIDAVIPGSVQDSALITKIGTNGLRQPMFQDIAAQALAWTRTTQKVRVDVNRARTAVGLAPVGDDAAVKPGEVKTAGAAK